MAVHNATKPVNNAGAGNRGGAMQQPQQSGGNGKGNNGTFTNGLYNPNAPLPQGTVPIIGANVRAKAAFDDGRDRKTRRPAMVEIEMRGTGALDLFDQFASRLNVGVQSDEFMLRMSSFLRDRGQTLTSFLDDIDPSENYTGPMREMDAFQRQLALYNIRTQSVPSKGIVADKLERFFQSNQPGSQILFPEFVDRVLRENPITPGILEYLIATTSGIDGDVYSSIYVDDKTDERRMKRVGQGAEIPRTYMKTKENAIRLWKYGRAMEGSYEFFRRVSIDLFAVFLRRVAMQNELDKSLDAVDVLINGDGNSNAATVYAQSALDTGNTPTFAAYLAFGMKFFPFKLMTLVGNAASLTKFLTMTYPNTDPLAVLAFLTGNQAASKRVEMPQNFMGPVNLVYLPDMAGNILVGLDNRFALEHLIENGSSLVETDKFITSQRNVIAVSERNGFSKIYNQAVAVWDWDS